LARPLEKREDGKVIRGDSGEGVQRQRNVFVTDPELTPRLNTRQVQGVTETGANGERVLVVDDEPDIVALVAYHLAKSGYAVLTATSGPEGLALARREKPSLIVLDLMLPGLSGQEVMGQLRADASTARIAVLMLTARREESDRIHGLTLGADDYLTKPFSPQELVLRVGAILRRVKSGTGESGGVQEIGPLTIDSNAHRVTVDGRDVELTPTEFKLLLLLAERKGRVQPRNMLLEIVWEAAPDIQTRTVDMHVQRLRAKLGAAGDMIETVRGFGYRLRSGQPRTA
jgi:two-component system, OmpR family, phosphate regulon response regulator PhoB